MTNPESIRNIENPEDLEDIESIEHGIQRRAGSVRVDDFILVNGHWIQVDYIGRRYFLVEGKSLFADGSPRTEQSHPDDFSLRVRMEIGGGKTGWHRKSEMITRHPFPKELALHLRRKAETQRRELDAMCRAAV